MPKLDSGPIHTEAGFHSQPARPSLSEVHRSLVVPGSASFARKLFAFAGPGFLVAVGYMDPGNWATDLAGGSKYNFALLSVVMMSNLMAILLQALSLKLGIATGRDLAQACRDHYSRPVSFLLWVICELAIAACDLAEIIGGQVHGRILAQYLACHSGLERPKAVVRRWLKVPSADPDEQKERCRPGREQRGLTLRVASRQRLSFG